MPRLQPGGDPLQPAGCRFSDGQISPDEAKPESKRNAAKYFNDHNWDVLETLEKLAKKRGKSMSQMALGWLLSQPVVTCPIIGPRSIDQLTDNLGAAGLRLEPEEIRELDLASAAKTV